MKGRGRILSYPKGGFYPPVRDENSLSSKTLHFPKKESVTFFTRRF